MKREISYILLGLVLLVLIGVGVYFEITKQSITGVSTLSLSQAQLQSSNPYLSGKVWLLTFSAGGLGQSYYGRFSPSDVQSATSDSSTTTKDFTIKVDYDNQIWNYPILQTSSNKPIYDIQVVKWTYDPFFNPCTVDEAKSRGLSNVLWATKPSLSVTCYGIGYNTQSPIGAIENPTLSSTYTISISTPSGTATKTLTTQGGSSQGAIGSYAYAYWLGNLDSGISFPSQSSYKTAYVNGVWRVVGSSAYSNYVSIVNQIPPSTTAGLDAWITSLQSSVSNAKISKSFGTVNSATSLNNAIIKITTSNPVQFPVTTLYIKASEIGIYTPTPDFSFVSTNSQCFQTGEQGTISVTIKNNGESGTGNVYAQCNSPFQTTQNVQVSLNKGETKTIYLPLSASADKEIKSSCTVYVESPGGTKSTSVNTCVKPQITCEPNKIFCSTSGGQDVIKQCSSDGATSSITKICSVNEYCDIQDGQPTCIQGEKKECKWYDITCKLNKIIDTIGRYIKTTAITLGIILLIIGIIAVIIMIKRRRT